MRALVVHRHRLRHRYRGGGRVGGPRVGDHLNFGRRSLRGRRSRRGRRRRCKGPSSGSRYNSDDGVGRGVRLPHLEDLAWFQAASGKASHRRTIHAQCRATRRAWRRVSGAAWVPATAAATAAASKLERGFGGGSGPTSTRRGGGGWDVEPLGRRAAVLTKRFSAAVDRAAAKAAAAAARRRQATAAEAEAARTGGGGGGDGAGAVLALAAWSRADAKAAARAAAALEASRAAAAGAAKAVARDVRAAQFQALKAAKKCRALAKNERLRGPRGLQKRARPDSATDCWAV